LIFFGRSEKKERGGEMGFQTGPIIRLLAKVLYFSFCFYCKNCEEQKIVLTTNFCILSFSSSN